MAVKLSPEDVAKLGPSAKAQLHTVQPGERPAPKRRRRNAEELRIARARASREEAKTSAFTLDRTARQQRTAEDRARQAQGREQRRQATVKRKLTAQRERETNQRAAARSARIGTIRTVGVRAGRGTSRAAGRIPSNVSASGLFGVVTGAALIGALVYRADTISALLGHMTAYWQRVIGLGKASK